MPLASSDQKCPVPKQMPHRIESNRTEQNHPGDKHYIIISILILIIHSIDLIDDAFN